MGGSFWVTAIFNSASSVDLKTLDESATVHVTMLPNPSHLEAVNPVACGKARARHLSRRLGEYNVNGEEAKGVMGGKVVCIQV